MPRKFNETYHDFRNRIMNPISDTFCAAKWYNATIWLGNGKTVSCHHPSPHDVNLTDIKTNPSALHNTREKKVCRSQMLAGERPDECRYCWRVEDLGKDHISDRTFKTVIYQDAEINSIATLDPSDDVNPKTLEISFDRTCNFACSYCNPTFSTTWTKDIKRNGPYGNLIGSNKMAYQSDGTWADPFDKSDNPYIAAFWNWWPSLSQSLTELRITGGEPLMSDDVWKLLNMFKTQNIGHIRLAINSNLVCKPELLDRLIENVQHIDHFDLYTSCESVGPHAEFIRDGMIYSEWCNNVERLMAEPKVERLHFMCTINALCLFSLTDFIDQVLEWKHKFGRVNGKVGLSFNMLSYPSFQSFNVLPNAIITSIVSKFESWRHCVESDPAFELHERESFDRLVSVLRDSCNITVSDNDVADFKSFFTQYCSRRNKDINVFPEQFVDWLNQVPVRKIIPIGAIG